VKKAESLIDRDSIDKIDQLEHDQDRESEKLDAEMDMFFGSGTSMKDPS
jgi:hypothetical protein